MYIPKLNNEKNDEHFAEVKKIYLFCGFMYSYVCFYV